MVRLTVRFDMTIIVDWGDKQQTNKTIKITCAPSKDLVLSLCWVHSSFCCAPNRYVIKASPFSTEDFFFEKLGMFKWAIVCPTKFFFSSYTKNLLSIKTLKYVSGFQAISDSKLG